MTTETRKILQLTLGTPLDGTEFFEVVQGGESRKIPTSALPLIDFGYLTVNSQGALTNSRRLVAGAGIVLMDSGPGGTLTINSTGGVNFADPTASIGLVVKPGVAVTAMRSDAAPPLDVSIAPTWTALHAFNVTPTVPNGSWTYAKIQNVSATSRLLGRITAGSGVVEELTGTQATTLLDVFTSLLKGLVPASGGGTTTFLRADGAFAVPAGGVTGLANPTASVGLAAVNGVATTAMRSDAAPALDQTIAPTWTATHTFNNTPVVPNSSWTYAKIQNVSATSRVLGRITAGAGVIEELTAASLATIIGTALGANPTASVGLTAINGTAGTYMRSDAAPAISQSISPTWTGNHTWTGDSVTTIYRNTATAAVMQLGTVKGVTGAGSVTDAALGWFGTNFSVINSNTARVLVNVAAAAITLGNATDNPAFTFTGTGAGTIAGQWTFTAPAASRAVRLLGAATSFTLEVTAANTSGQSFGAIVNAGTTSADTSFLVRNQASTKDFLSIKGDGTTVFGNTTDNPTYSFVGTGNFGTGSRTNSLGSTTSSSQAVQAGHSGSGYGAIGVNVVFTTTGGVYNYGVTDTAGLIDFDNDALGWVLKRAVTGTAGAAITFRNMAAFGSSALSFGNATDNQAFTWLGTGTWSVGGSVGSAGQVLTSNGAGSAPTWQGAGGITKFVRTTDLDRTSTATLADDTVLVASGLAANKRYSVECFIRWNQQGAINNGIQMRLNVTGGAPSVNWAVFSSLTNTTSGNSTPTGNSSDDISAFSQTIGTAGITICTYLVATVTADAATALAIAFQWAQATSQATATRLLAGSWMKITQLN